MLKSTRGSKNVASIRVSEQKVLTQDTLEYFQAVLVSEEDDALIDEFD